MSTVSVTANHNRPVHLQTAKRLQELLRIGAFDMWEHSPRMLPRAFTPQRLDVETGAKSQPLPRPKARRRAAGRGHGRGAASAAAAAAPAGDYGFKPPVVQYMYHCALRACGASGSQCLGCCLPVDRIHINVARHPHTISAFATCFDVAAHLLQCPMAPQQQSRLPAGGVAAGRQSQSRHPPCRRLLPQRWRPSQQTLPSSGGSRQLRRRGACCTELRWTGGGLHLELQHPLAWQHQCERQRWCLHPIQNRWNIR